MNKIRIDNLDIDYDRDYHTIDEASSILKSREDRALTKAWFMLKLRNRELLSIYDGANQLFINIDRYDSMFGIQFYNACGELIMTYPWNGKMSLYNEGQLVNDYKERFGTDGYNRLTAIDVIIRNNEIIICDEVSSCKYDSLSKGKKQELRVFDFDGNEKSANLLLTEKSQIDFINSIRAYSIDAKFMSKNDERNSENNVY